MGEVRLTPLDVGFDVRRTRLKVRLPAEFASAGIDIRGQTYLIEGTRDEMVQAIQQAGYSID